MSLSLILRFAQRSVVTSLLPTVRSLGGSQLATAQNFHSICDNRTREPSGFLKASPLPLINSNCGMKTKGILHLRCKDCYFVWRKNRKYVMCKTYGRHKQQAIVKDEKNTWIITSMSQGRIRPW